MQGQSSATDGTIGQRDSSLKTSRMHIFPLTCTATYTSRKFCCQLQSFGDTTRRDVIAISQR